MCLRFLFALLIVSVPAYAFGAEAGGKRIAITFDDAPRAADALLDLDTRTETLIASLARGNVPGAMFFATTRNLAARGDEGAVRLRRYVDAGHVLANHSHAHDSASRLEAGDYLADVERAHRILSGYDGYLPLFRFPFLNEGNTPEKRDAIRDGLVALELEQGYVTVDNYDWYLQSLFSEAVRAGLPLDLDAWCDVYVDILSDAVAFYDAIAVRTLGRSPAHVLLLHENDLAALFIDDLVAALRADGWEIIPAAEAFEDPMAGQVPDTMLLGQGRVAAIAAAEGAHWRELIHPLESEADLRALLVARGLIDLAEGAYLGQAPPGLAPAKFAPGIVSLPDRYEYGSVFSADGRELFFGVATDGRGAIHAMRFADGQWQPPDIILSDPGHSFADPFLSRDGTRLYFISTPRVDGQIELDDADLWYVRRERDGWSEPVNLGAPINTGHNEYYVSFADDGTLAFASGVEAKVRGDYNLYLSQPIEGGFAPPQNLGAPVNTRWYEADPFIAPDGSYILFGSNRRPNAGKRDIFATFRLPDGAWSEPVALGNGVNTPALELCPMVTRDGRFLFYTSNEDIYWVDAAVIDIARERAIGSIAR